MNEVKKSIPCPSEDIEQRNLIEACRMLSSFVPELALLMHIPNGGSRNKAEAAKLKTMGVRAGVPDLLLPIARKGFHGLWIELKKQHGGKVSEEQQAWIDKLAAEGYRAVVSQGAAAAITEICNYIDAPVVINNGLVEYVGHIR